MNDFCCKRRIERSGRHLQRFNDHSLPRLPFQDEQEFTVYIKTNHHNNRVYSNGRDVMLSQENYSVKETSFPLY